MPPLPRDVRLPVAFAGTNPPSRWPRPRSAPRPEALELGVETLPRVGRAVRGRLAKLGLRTVGDLLAHRPRRYERPIDERSIRDLFGDGEAVIAGVVLGTMSRRGRGRLRILTARVADDTGEISATWFNQPWLEAQLPPGTRVRLRGKPNRFGFQVESYDLGEATETADFAPVYPASEALAQKQLRALVAAALEHARAGGDPLPAIVAATERLPLRADALVALHRPRSLEEAEVGRQRLAFDELLVLQLALARRQAERERLVAEALPPAGDLLRRYREVLPFTLTEAQESAIGELDRDLASTMPMQRLLQGDVGSGKTVVALYALLRAVEADRQGALMAPTEVLAEQHFLTIEGICSELGVIVALLTSALGAKEHANVRQLIASGDIQIAVGTHALIQREVAFRDLAVAVVDEQHRFGVEQRSALAGRGGESGSAAGTRETAGVSPERAGETPHVLQEALHVLQEAPHVLHMTATPIPRTLALTVYGDLSVSEISSPPAERKPVVTAWVTDDRSSEAYERLRRHLADGRQAYVVCPLIEASETTVARAAEDEAERLRRAELRGFRVGCLHGRVKPAVRRALMAEFKAGEIDVLVATTVIEVGVDVPNATIMIVQEADRFGLAQLHQLRGRVGRGAEQSYCLLVSSQKEKLTDVARDRLEAMVQTTDGFELAERDLDIRGEGQLLGARQSGLSDLRFTRLREDQALLERARDAACGLADEGLLAESIDRLFGESEHVGES